MKFTEAIDAYLRDQRMLGRINSDRTEVSYRSRLMAHAADIGNRDPRTVGREDIKTTLRRWEHPNTQRNAHAILAAFYDWCMEEAIRPTNPARQVRRAKKRPVSVYRLNRAEVLALLGNGVVTQRERWTVYLGVLAGARNRELRGFQGRHFARPGWVHFSKDIAKGGKEGWVPVLAELEPIVAEIQEHVEPDQFVIPARWPANPPLNTRWTYYPERPCSAQAIWRLVDVVARRAGIAAHIHPHLLRHAYGDHVAKHAGLRVAQALMRHDDVSTTASTYVDRPTLDEIAVSVHGFSFSEWRAAARYEELPLSDVPGIAGKATTGIEPVDSSCDVAEGQMALWLTRYPTVESGRPDNEESRG